jgi:ribosomal protein L36
MGRFVDSIIAYRILKMLVTPFVDTEAYRLGIIDENGKEIKNMAKLNTVAERDAYSILHRMVYRIKRIIEKVPVENKKLLSFAAALSLIKEHAYDTKEPIDLESRYLDRLHENLYDELEYINEYFEGKQIFTFKQFNEEGEGAPGVAGLTKDTVGVSKSVQKKLQLKNKITRRNGSVNVIPTNNN